ncbi:asparagine synthase-related protein [Thermodesulfovibrio thiophilus]|uniref:asparagine synthase-related protein n=1 Tax=Thermodesulfovibrio thiophilus TaxID=340095 RepID=UPI0017B011C3|nr:asparagine synthase-related protein [Thermodesulfovibrio thiophilus]HHW21082.1 hypothetical protein [Thermodesulfovibrio thiophilus]
MVSKVTSSDCPKIIEGDVGGEKPIYLYLDSDKKYLLYSDNIKELLDSPEVKKPLSISSEGLSFYLQKDILLAPKTIYENLFVINIGDSVHITSIEGKIKLEFFHKFPFFNSERNPQLELDVNYLLSLISKAVFDRLIPEKPIFLFQSLGKDSNTIALALAEAGLQNKVTCVTLSTKDRKDESEIASKVAVKLGFKHQKLTLPSKIEKKHLDVIDYYFTHISLPCLDGSALVYPLYATLIDFKDTNIIDGSGNDIYFGHVPRPVEYKRQKVYPKFIFLRPLAEQLPTGNILQRLALTRCEMICKMMGLTGFTYRDAKKIYPDAVQIYPYWKEEDKKRKNWDYFDLRADIRGASAHFDLMIRKVRNFAEIFDINLILPWTNSAIANYIGKVSEKCLFDRKRFKNKLPLRRLLKERLGIDSDALGKYSYGFNAYKFLKSIDFKVKEEVIECKLWDSKYIQKLFKIIAERAEKNKMFQKLYTKLFVISGWFNHNKYLK